jgi:glutathione S-transferase
VKPTVLDGYLARQKQEQSAGSNGPWLVGNKLSYADMAFIPWQRMVPMFLETDKYDMNKFPHVKEWFDKMISRDSVKTAIEECN